MTSVKKLLVVLGIIAIVLGGTSWLVAQDQLNLHDGGLNNMFTGGNAPPNPPNQINLTMESQNCPGQLCGFAISTAMGINHLASNGNYSITTPKGAPVMGGFAGPFFLTVQPDGHSTVTQTAPITFNYNSAQGTLTGSIVFTSVSATQGCCSTMLGTFTATGGTFAQFFPNGGSVSVVLGLAFPLQFFPLVPHAQTVLEFQSGTITANSPQLVLTCAANMAQVGVPYDSFLVASGGIPPYTYSIVGGSLPPGLTLNPNTGEISGTPTTPGTYNYTAKAVDSVGNMVQTNCSIMIPAPGLVITCASGTGEVGVPYDSFLMASGGMPPYTFSIISGSLPPGLTLNASTGEISGIPTSQGSFNFIVEVTDSLGNMAMANCSITITTCGTALTPISYNVHEDQQQQGEIAWFNSHLTRLSGTIPSSDFQIYITGGHLTFGNMNIPVPDAVMTFSSSATCASTTFNTSFNRFESTFPLSAASSADELFAAGVAFQVPLGIQNVDNVTWSADISASAPGIIASWQFGASNWFLMHNGSTFPNLSLSPFVPDYNGMKIKAVHGAIACYGIGGDHAGAPEFIGRNNLLTGGGSGGGGSNWTGSWSSTPRGVRICDPNGMLGARLVWPFSSSIASTRKDTLLNAPACTQ